MLKKSFIKIQKCTVFLTIVFVMSACSTIFENYDKKILENKEFDEHVKIKEIDAPVVPVSPESTEPVAPVLAGVHKKSKTKAISENSKSKIIDDKKKDANKAEQILDAKEIKNLKHLPELEDSEGFVGRRPIVDPFVVGEVLEFSVHYFAVEGGRLTMTTKPFVELNGKKSYHFSYYARSSSVFSLFYAVDDKADTYMDYEQLVPYSYSISAKESKQIRDVKSFSDWKTMRAKTWDKKIKKNKEPEIKDYAWAIAPYAQNVFTVSYYLRAFTLAVGKKLAVNVAHEGANIVMTAEVVREEKLSTPMGKLDTFVIKPSFEIDGVFKPVGDVFLWVTKDKHKRLVRIESKIKIGKVVASIEKITP